MKRQSQRSLRAVMIGGLLLANIGAISSAYADDDRGWQEHRRHEDNWRSRHDHHQHWDHRYWDRDDDGPREGYAYHPPVVYYDPPPPVGLNFIFRSGR